MNALRWTSTLLLPFLLSGCTIGHSMTRLQPVKQESGDQAAYYALPRTVVSVGFEVKKVETAKGAKIGDVSCFDRLEDAVEVGFVPAAGSTTGDGDQCDGRPCLWQAIGLDELPKLGEKFKVSGTPTLAAAAEPDPDQIFRVDLGSSAFKKREIQLTYGAFGVLEGGTSLAHDRRVDIALAAAQTVLQIGTTFVLFNAPDPTESELLRLTTAAPPADRCQRAAFEINKARSALADLESNVGSTYDADEASFLEELWKKRIAHNLAFFFTVKETIGTVRCAVRPLKGMQASLEVLRIDQVAGVAPGGDADCLVPTELASPAASGGRYTLSVERFSDDLSLALESYGVGGAHDDSKKQGFYYRVPALTRVTLEEVAADGTTKTRAETDLLVAQLGIIAALPAQRTYQTKYIVTLDPLTGALKTLSATSEAIDPSLVSDTGSAIVEAREARAEQAEEAAKAKDELTLLTRERQILEEKKKIRDFKEALGEDEP